MTKIRVASLFSGIGGFETGIFNAFGKKNVDVVFSSEIDKYANFAYETLYGHKTSGDITKVEAKDVPDHDILVGGFPCFPKGQKVITKDGFKNIEEITENDLVLTHKGRYRKVVTPMSKIYNGKLFSITPNYYRFPIEATSEHPFWTKDGWKEAHELTVNDYVGFPLNKKRELPKQFTYEKKRNQFKTDKIDSSLPFEKEVFWELIGYWLAEGWTIDSRKKNGKEANSFRLVFSAAGDKQKYLIDILDELKINYSLSKEKPVDKIHVIKQELWMFIKQFTNGKTAGDKVIPEFVQNLPIKYLKALIKGYFNGDGHIDRNASKERKTFTSISLSMLESFQRIFLKTEKKIYTVAKLMDEREFVIEGRTVQGKKSYILRETIGNKLAFFDDNYVYLKISKTQVEEVQELEVFNIEVEEDNSYCLPIVAVHNCQAFSISGKRRGFEDTRGTLFFEIARIAKEKQPKLMLLENVKGLVSHDKGKTLQTIVQTLCDIGYTVDFKVLNSKFFSVPQNRERIFIVALRDGVHQDWVVSKEKNAVNEAKRNIQQLDGIKTFNFEFPEEVQVEKSIRDILEENVDEKYYMSKDRIKQFVQKEILENQDIHKIGFIKNNKEQNRVRKTDGIMPTITANNQGGRRPGGLNAEEEKKMKQIGYIDKNAQGNRVYSVDGIGPTVSSQTGGAGGSGGGVFAIEDDRLKDMLEEDIQDIVSKSRKNTEISIKFKENGDIRPHRNDPKKSGISELNINHEDNVSFTVTASHSPKIYGETTFYRIRKLTPLECFRLQNFPDEYYYQLKKAGVSDSQLYKMAGNAVTTNVIEALMKRMKRHL